MNHSLPKLIVMYEDMRACLVRELLRVSSFLATPVLTKYSVCCALANSVGGFYRNQGRAPVHGLYPDILRKNINSRLTAMAENIKTRFPILAKRILNYRLI